MLQPLKDCLWIDPEPPPEYHVYAGIQKRSGLVVPEKYLHGPEDRPVWGKVMAVGPEVTRPELTVGARVVFGKWAPAKFQYQEKEYMFIREGDVLGVDPE